MTKRLLNEQSETEHFGRLADRNGQGVLNNTYHTGWGGRAAKECSHSPESLELNGGDPPHSGVPVKCNLCGRQFGEVELDALGVDIIFLGTRKG